MKNYKFFEAYKTQSAGVWFFVPESGVLKIGKPCNGFGSIKYAEGSVYTGEIYYDGKNFNKLGYGRQEFTRSTIGNIIPELGEKAYLFIGEYDYRKTDWIYGDGVLYYTYEDGAPSHFKKGFFSGLNKIGDYKGDFDFQSLLQGYTPDMEFDFDEGANRLKERWEEISGALNKAQRIDTLLIGDSYFELSDNYEFAGKNLFKNLFKNFVNIGVGGSTFLNWIAWAENIKDIPAPEKIVINLGFNDLHNGRTVDDTYGDFLTLIKILRGYFPESKFYLISVVHSPNCPNYYDAENQYNSKIAANAKKNGVIVGDWNSRIAESGLNCFHADAIHPNEYGYGLFADFIKELVNKN